MSMRGAVLTALSSAKSAKHSRAGPPRLSPWMGTAVSVEAARSHQAQRDREQLVLRRDAKLLVGALAIGQRGMQADAELGGDRLRAEAGEDALANLLLAAGQRGERRGIGKQRLQPQQRVAPRRRVLLETPLHSGAHRRHH